MTLASSSDPAPTVSRVGLSAARLAVPLASPRLRASMAAGAGAVVGNALGVALPFVVTAEFSAGRATDAYFLVSGGAQFAVVVVTLLGSPVLAFVGRPVHDVPGCGFTLARKLTPYALLIALPVTVGFLVLVAAVLVPTSGFTTAQRHESHQLLIALAAYPLLASCSAVFTGVSYAQGNFARTSSSPALRGGAGILAAVLLGPEFGITAVAAGLTAGELLRCVTLAASVRRGSSSVGGSELPVAPSFGRDFLRVSSPAIASNAISAVNPLIDKAVAVHLGVGYITLIELAEKLFYLPTMLLVTTITTVSGAAWAQIADDTTELRRDYWNVQRVAVRVTCAVTVMAAVVVLAGSGVLGRALHIADPSLFAEIFLLYIVALPIAMSAQLGARLLVSIQRTTLFPALAVAAVAVNVGGDLAGAALLGILGVAAASTAVRCLNALFFVGLSKRELDRRMP